jgi:hypothetical protein
MAGQISESAGMNMLSSEISLSAPNTPATQAPVTDIVDHDDHQARSDVMGDDKVHGSEPEQGVESKEQETKANEPAAPAELTITAGKTQHKFKLDANDPELQKALKLGVGARKWQAERDALRKELETFKSGDLTERAQVWDELKELRNAGHLEQVARLVLDSQFDALKEQIIQEYRVSEEGTPDEQYAHKMTKTEQAQKWKDDQARKEIEKLRSELDARDDRVREDTLKTRAESMLRKYDMSQYVADANEAHELNSAVWELALTNLMNQHGESNTDPSTLEVERAFARAAKILRGGRSKVVENRVQAVTEQKREAAREAAKTASTKNYSTSADANKVKDWDGRSAKSLFASLGLR